MTSEVAARDVATRPSSCATSRASSLGPAGTLSAIDAAKAVTDPAHAVIARVGAGCSPARVSFPPSGDVAWVTARGDDCARLDTRGGCAPIRCARCWRPSPSATPRSGSRSRRTGTSAVADSHRSRDADQARASAVTVLDAAQALAGGPQSLVTIPSGALAREVLATPDGSFLVTNYNAKSILMITPPRATDRRDSES